jgi:hypothetical protein
VSLGVDHALRDALGITHGPGVHLELHLWGPGTCCGMPLALGVYYLL